MLKLLNDEMNVPIFQHEIVSVSRMGQGKDARLPIAVEFKTLELKDRVLNGRFNLQGRPYTLESYMSKGVLDRQRQLIPLMMKFRAHGRFCVIRHGKLILDGKIRFDATRPNFEDNLQRFLGSFPELEDPQAMNVTKGDVPLTYTTEKYTRQTEKYAPKKPKKSKKKKLLKKMNKLRDVNENRIGGLSELSGGQDGSGAFYNP